MKFDPRHDPEELCVCGHTYYRHFDWADDYRPGCKYCPCHDFAPAVRGRMPVVCLCGSTRFKRTFETWSARLALAGEVPLTVSLFSHADGIELTADQVMRLNAVHAARIRLADAIFVLDVDGYIGEGTKADIRLAESLGKTVRYLSVEHPGWKEPQPEAASGLRHPFPGADAHPDKLGGDLCVEGTEVLVASLLRRLSDGYTTSSAMEALGILNAPVFECLRGLADWLQTQDWTGEAAQFHAAFKRRWGKHIETMDAALAMCDQIDHGYAEGVTAAFDWLQKHKQDQMSPDNVSSLSDAISDAAHAMKDALLPTSKLSGTAAQRIVDSDHGTNAMSTSVAREVVRIGKNAFDTTVARVRVPLPGAATEEAHAAVAAAGPLPEQPTEDTTYDIAQAKIRWAKEHGRYRDLIEQALAACVMRGASSVMPLEMAKVILSLDRKSPGVEGGFRCKGCGVVFLASAKGKEGRPCVRGGHVVCPECARAWPVDPAPVEKRCGTCQFGQGDLCAKVRFATVPDAGIRRDFNIHYLAVELAVGNAPDGPPWENCRFWKPREERERE